MRQSFDVGSAIDHHILNWYAKNVDAFRFSGYMYKPRNGLLVFGPVWDLDRSMGAADDPRPVEPRGFHNEPNWDGGACYFEHPGPGGDSGRLGSWYGLFFNNEPPLGQTPWARAYRARWNEVRAGPLRTEKIHAKIDAWAAVLVEPARRNFRKFGSFTPRFGGYQGEVRHLKNWLKTRAEWIDDQFDIVPLAAPTFSRRAGRVPEGSQVELRSESGVVFYTLNDRDPLRSDGSPTSGAKRYSKPIAISKKTRIRARVRVDDGWSDLVEATYNIDEG